jgi:hypothetical protein
MLSGSQKNERREKCMGPHKEERRDVHGSLSVFMVRGEIVKVCNGSGGGGHCSIGVQNSGGETPEKVSSSK